ncbi:MAG: beta-L-arabinofuranosidase domain-containing protein [Anaerolineales bacterium]
MTVDRRSSIKAQAFQWLRLGEIRPAGWMRAQMQRDLEEGFVGHLDELVPDLICKDDIYGTHRLTRAVRSKDLGVLAAEKEWEVQFLWWNSETQSNWWDGLLRTALLLEHPDFLPKVQTYMEHILATQAADGYLGIYAPDLRFHFDGENGELWAQATLLRGLLGYYEATGQAAVLEAVQRAVRVTMQAWPAEGAHPFSVERDYAGVCHGLMFTDVLDRLYQLTGQAGYLEYAAWLYQEYSRDPLSAADVQTSHLLDPAWRFQAHGVHTFEQARALLTAVYASEDAQLQKALEGYLAKLEPCLAPSGAPIGDEMIDGRRADASETGYEYCSIQELLDSYSHLLQKTGQARWADRIEWLLFNAGQGARHPYAPAIAYLKTDNSSSMTGRLHPDDLPDAHGPQTRYKYSPVHQDVAVCCVPNAGRIYPYYVKAMGMRTPEGLAICLYGASEFQTEVAGVPVRVSQRTEYPFDLGISFRVEVPRPVSFELAFRRPAWADGVTCRGAEGWRTQDGWIKLGKTWQPGDQVALRFETGVRVNPFRPGEFFLSYGPLMFVMPLAGREALGREYPLPGYCDRFYFPPDGPAADWRLIPGRAFRLEAGRPDPAHPWDGALFLAGSLFNAATQRIEPVRLIPFGGSLLRQATFRYT